MINAKCSPSILEEMKEEDRNTSFRKVVIDRRRGKGYGAECVVCCSDNVVLTYDTRTGESNFHIIERKGLFHYSHGDDFARCCNVWPDIDRGGEYKRYIDRLSENLKRGMVLVRQLLSGQ